MKRKISSLIVAVFVLFACIFASGCGDKYEDLEFKVYYAFSEDATTWHDGTDGISLVYNLSDEYEGGERSSLIFEGGEAKLYIRVEILNVKAKHVGAISISPTSTNGLKNVGTIQVEQKDVVCFTIEGRVETKFNIFENNSGKKKELPLTISRELEKIEVKKSDVQPAMWLNSSLDLKDLDNLSYLPNGLTNQVGVTYSIESVGYYNGGNFSGNDSAKNYVYIEDDVLKLHDPEYFKANKYSTAHVVRVKATSIYHNGENGEDPIETTFEVVLAESSVSAPLAKFESVSGIEVFKDEDIDGVLDRGCGIHLYKNGGEKYSKSTVVIDKTQLQSDSIFYQNKMVGASVSAVYKVAVYVYVDDRYQKCDFDNQNVVDGQIGINGLYIQRVSEDKDSAEFIFSITEDENINSTNQIKFVYEIDGLNFFNEQNNNLAGPSIPVYKSVLPTKISINNKDYAHGESLALESLSTSDPSYKGLELLIAASPNTDSFKTLNITGGYTYNNNGELVNSIKSGSTVYVKLDHYVSEKEIELTTLKTPEYYNNEEVKAEEYITVTLNITNVVTADSFEFVKKDKTSISELLISAENISDTYVKVNYNGSTLAERTIKLQSSNSKVLFTNGKDTMLLSEVGAPEFSGTNSDGTNYSIYKIQLAATNSQEETYVEIFVDHENIHVSKDLKVNAVFLLNDASTIDVVSDSENIKEFLATDVDNNAENFAIGKGEFAEFVVKGNNENKRISSISIETQDPSAGAGAEKYSVSALRINTVSNSTFTVVALTAAKTQVLEITINFYKLDADNNIVLDSLVKTVQIAVFDPIGRISYELSRSEIGFINPYFEEITSSKLSFNSYSSTFGSPADSVWFWDKDAATDIEVSRASQIKFTIENFETVKKNGISVVYNYNNLTNGAYSSKTVDELNGDITIGLSKIVEELKSVTIRIEALRFGQLDPYTSTTAKINIVKVDKVNEIAYDTTNFVNNELELSFIDVPDGGYDEAEFGVELKYKNAQEDNTLRFEDIETNLTHILYKYDLNGSGEVVGEHKIQSSFFDVIYADGKVKVRARKNLDGGRFKLVLVTKDSYLLENILNSAMLSEGDFEKKVSINVRVSDGKIGSEYVIREDSDLDYIQHNMDKNFVLGANLGVDAPINISPIGVENNDITPFEGSLSGRFTTSDGLNNVSVYYSINMLISETSSSTEGDVYGLFGMLGQNANVSDLKINVSFGPKASTNINGAKVGVIAAINKGNISNCEINVLKNSSSENIDISNISKDVDFGMVVGVNENKIERTKVLFNASTDHRITIISNTSSTHKVGLIAGTNTGTISGNYLGKESLNSFVYDVISNLKIQNTASGSVGTYYVGTIAGINTGTIEKLLVGGYIGMDGNNSQGSLGGLVGFSNVTTAGDSSVVSCVVALSLNVESTSNGVHVGGIVGKTQNANVNYVKFVSAATRINDTDYLGCVSGLDNVGGIIGWATKGEIKEASVESFVKKIVDEASGDEYIHPTIKDGTNTAGLALVDTTDPATVERSFVNANIASDGNIYLTSNNTSESYTYFIGEVKKLDLTTDATFDNKATYMFGGLTNVEVYLTPRTNYDDITDKNNAYIFDGSNYVKVDAEVAGAAGYYELNSEAWLDYVQYTLINNGSWISGSYSTNGYYWRLEENYNVVNVSGVELFLPFIVRGDNTTPIEPLQIVEPKGITAAINETYITNSNSIYINEFKFEDYAPLVEATAIVNFLNKESEENNAHDILDLITHHIIPSDDNTGDFYNAEAQGGLVYKILGNGVNYAYINNSNQIVFTGASGKTPILVEISSVFNPKVKYYVAFYSQSLFEELTLTSNSVNQVIGMSYKYETNAYTGQNDKLIVLNANNDGNNTIFDVKDIGGNLIIEAKSDKYPSSKLLIDTTSHSNITLKIKELLPSEKIELNEYEIVTFKLFLKKEYFGAFGSPAVNHISNNVFLGEISLRVNLFNSAKEIVVEGSDFNITTNDDIEFNVTLNTDYVDETRYSGSDFISEDVLVNNQGEIYLNVTNTDYILVSLNVVEGEKQIENLITKNAKDYKTKYGIDLIHFAQLFDISIVSGLYKSNDPTPKTRGYVYNISLVLKQEHSYRYITENVKFNISVRAHSNKDVNNNENPLEITLKPTVLSTARIENYAVQDLQVNNDYSTLVSHGTVQTSIVQPGAMGNVMMIYLEPTYSNVERASLTSSELHVPSLGRTVKLHFTQLVYDNRNGTKAFTTLTGSNNSTQADGTLNLSLISELDEQGNPVYTGVICVLIQLEKFVGLEAGISVTLNVKTSGDKEIIRTRDLLTTYLPSVNLNFNNQSFDNGYLIQRGSSNNEIEFLIYGYQFNSNPSISLKWYLPVEGEYRYLSEDKKHTIYLDADGDEVYDNGETKYLIGNYVSISRSFSDIVYDEKKETYSLKTKLTVSENIPAAFTLNATLSLTTKDGQIVTSDKNNLIFYPTDYIINEISIKGLVNNTFNLPIDVSRQLEIYFETDNEFNDLSSTIYLDLLRDIYNSIQAFNFTKTSYEEKYNELASFINALTNEKKERAANKLANLFSYNNGSGFIKFSNHELHPNFEFNVVNGTLMSLTGVGSFKANVQLEISYNYNSNDQGLAFVKFGDIAGGKPQVADSNFTLDVYSVNNGEEIVVYSADEIYNSSTGTWNLIEGKNYVLMNDITLENVVPITTKIAGFDGNNRVISIKNFVVDQKLNEYGLFANIGTYVVEDKENGTSHQEQTILRNMIVDYSKYDGSLSLISATNKNIVFGGLVGTNNGGLIYNCDIMNLNPTSDVEFDLIVASDAKVKFGGLVGENHGIITNSRVGRENYTKITATKTIESSVNVPAGGLVFNIFNRVEDEEVNQFEISAGAFVGVNNGTISSSYVTKTSLNNYSSNELKNQTAGFVGINNSTGSIMFSYVTADEKTLDLDADNVYATGYEINNKGNGNVAGFVYENHGTISNAYSNIELKTNAAYIAGFVYSNASKGATISECYAATKMNSGNSSDNAEQPFVGVNSAGDLLSNGTLENTYYLMRSEKDDPFVDGEKDVAYPLNVENFKKSESLVGFAFILSNSQAEREQGIWSYYTLNSTKRNLPELINAKIVSHSHRYIVETANGEKHLINTVSYAEGTIKNPYAISSAEEFNKVFTSSGNLRNFIGNVRLINNIDFSKESISIETSKNFKLGDFAERTSIEGNGLSVSGIYLQSDEKQENRIGLFAEIENSYIKNVNLKFAYPSQGEGIFSTSNVVYAGGLAGTVKDSVVFNITLDGQNSILAGKSFVGGIAGLISGNSLVYGVETNLNVKSANENYGLYYSKTDYDALRISSKTYDEYLSTLSYAGGVAGVLDLTKRAGVDYNLQYINIRGDKMTARSNSDGDQANIQGVYAGGVAGYANEQVRSIRLKYFVGSEESIKGTAAVGGLFGVCLGDIIASQVTAEEDVQFEFDTKLGEYVMSLSNHVSGGTYPTLDTTQIGNTKLIQGVEGTRVGGIVGIALNSTLSAVYSKASFAGGTTIGGLIGMSVASVATYSYAIPYLNYDQTTKKVGGFIGEAYGIMPTTPDRNNQIKQYETLLKHKGVTNEQTDIQFTFSTVLLDDANYNYERSHADNVVIDYICADYKDLDRSYIQSNQHPNLMYVYAGTVKYSKDVHLVIKNQTNETNTSSIKPLNTLYNVGSNAQQDAFLEVFSGWSLIKYWNLNNKKYFPLLVTDIVDNFIKIEKGSDFELIRNNLRGSYEVTNDVTVDASTLGNWVVAGQFEGILQGKMENDSRRPIVTIKNLTTNTANESTGFFRSAYGATINNLVFRWDANNSQQSAINVDSSGITMVSGLICNDLNSLISNVEVCVQSDDPSQGNLVKTSAYPIEGFGGIVGTGVNTNIFGSRFVGSVDATIKATNGEASYVGGTMGSITTEAAKSNGQTGTITTAVVGASASNIDGMASIYYPKTQFKITIDENNTKNVYIGGSVGYVKDSATSANIVGGVDYSVDYQNIPILIKNAKNKKYVYAGGLIGYSDNSFIRNSSACTLITMDGEITEDNSRVYIGGLMGMNEISGMASGILGGEYVDAEIAGCQAKSKITIQGLIAKSDTHLMLSTGVATMKTQAVMKQCYFEGEINTEDGGNELYVVYAGGAVAYADADEDIIDLEEVATNTVMFVGDNTVISMYVGGLVGWADKLEMSYSVSWGRIIPIAEGGCLKTGAGLFVGGMIGKIDNGARVNNSYTTSSIISDSIQYTSLATIKLGALVGSIPNDSVLLGENESLGDDKKIGFTNVFYSTDYALCIDENYVKISTTDETLCPIGSNLSAAVLTGSTEWHDDLKTEDGELNLIWTTLEANGNDRMPYLTNIKEGLIKHGIITMETGRTYYDYVEGSAMKPKNIKTSSGSYVFDETEFKYYVLTIAGGTKATPKFTSALNGLLMAEDLEFSETFTVGELESATVDGVSYHGIIPHVTKHSAISNLHVVVDSSKEIQETTTTGIIAGCNKGVIFNCSVQGTGITFSGSGNAGLIAGVNNGTISHSFSTAEIIGSSVDVGVGVGGIVETNNGTLISNYFTGYICSTDPSAGILLNNAGYVYNNYMAGVITNIAVGGNAFHACGNINGEKNFIDGYSDIAYKNKEYATPEVQLDAYKILVPVATSDLMDGTAEIDGEEYILQGTWYFTVKDGNINTSAENFGYNYGYPVYKFNRKTVDGNHVQASKNQLYTGTGLFTPNYSPEITFVDNGGTDCWKIGEVVTDIPTNGAAQPSSIDIHYDSSQEKYFWKIEGVVTEAEVSESLINETSLEVRYSLIANSDSDTKVHNYYTDAYKIPHLGVLTTVHNLLAVSRNYVLIYDIDGQNDEWTAIGGANNTINGFNRSSTTDDTISPPVTTFYGFNGVFTTNKHYNATSTLGEVCLIKNLQINGLFGNIDNAYFGEIKFGSFENLQNSGALGTTVFGTDSSGASIEDPTQSNKLNVIVNSVSFETGSEIKSEIPSDPADPRVYVGGLFGVVYGNIQINNFTSGDASSSYVKLNGDISGLIAGHLNGGSIVLDKPIGAGWVATSNYSVEFNENVIAGGLVGLMTVSRGIEGNGSTINIYQTDDHEIQVLGGVVGKGKLGDDPNYQISNLIISLNKEQYKTKTFGGIVGVDAKFKAENITLTAPNPITIKFNAAGASERYYGLVAGLQTGEIEAEIKIDNKIEGLDITTSGNVNNTVDDKTSGTAIFVGAKTGGGLTVQSVNPEMKLAVNGVPNVGILIGYLEHADTETLDFSVTTEEPAGGEPPAGGAAVLLAAGDPKITGFTISGTVNVGGAFGWINANVTDNIRNILNLVQENEINIVGIEKDQTPTPDKSGSVADSRNIGGLLGKWTEPTVIEPPAGGVEPPAGGVEPPAGGVEPPVGGEPPAGGAVPALDPPVVPAPTEPIYITNTNKITFKDGDKSYNIGGVAGYVEGTDDAQYLTNNGTIQSLDPIHYKSHAIKLSADGEITEITKLMNVGGVVGYSKDTALVQLVNRALTIQGYQNVGGIVGYMQGTSNITNSYSITADPAVPSIELKFSDDGTTFEGGILAADEKHINTGDIYGVVNVGGAVGFADECSQINQVFTQTNVYGNANVGGLVGLTQKATLKNNYIQNQPEPVAPVAPAAAAVEPEDFGVVKGVYYNYAYDIADIKIASFISTGVGGLAGTTIDSTIANNIVDGVKITSSKESDGVVISLFTNHMAKLSLASGDRQDFVSAETMFNLTNESDELEFNSINSGYGGFVGTIDSSTINKVDDSVPPKSYISSNTIKGIKVNAELGINVSAFYGVYERGSDAIANEKISLPVSHGSIGVDGSFNIGGLIGFINGGGGTSIKGLNNSDMSGTATISLQENLTGFYVGGLFGKTNANTLEELSLVIAGESALKIYTDNCYYAGGLIGRADVGNNAKIQGNLGEWKKADDTVSFDGREKDESGNAVEVPDLTANSDAIIAIDNDKASNFGGIVGMLKVAANTASSDGYTVTVSGNHNMPFTVNTIENSNYTDGNSRYGKQENEEEHEVMLSAEANYVNNDTFNIDGSRNTDLYGDKEDAVNPINNLAKGWSKQYTGFKQLQRCMSQPAGSDVGWDSVAVLFDAAKITHVGTIKNLDLSGEDLPCKHDSDPMSTQEKQFNDDHVCFTVYEQAPGMETLYSAIGIASLYQVDNSGGLTYQEYPQPQNWVGNPGDAEAKNWFQKAWHKAKTWGMAVIMAEAPDEMNYLDLNSEYQDCDTRGLTYFNWSYSYNKIGTTTLQQYQSEYDGQTNVLTYKVPNYLNSGSGAYFVFDIVYQNHTTPIDGATDDDLPNNGLMFTVSGTMSDAAVDWKVNTGATDWFGVGVKALNVILTIVASVVTFGAATGVHMGIKAAGTALKAMAKTAIKFVAKHAGLALVATVLLSAVVKNQQGAALGYSTFVQPSSESYGFLSSSYTKELKYTTENGITTLQAESDSFYTTSAGEIYSSLSQGTRPSDLYTQKYIAVPLKVIDEGVYETNMDAGNVVPLTSNYLNGESQFENLVTSEYTVDGAYQTITTIEGPDDPDDPEKKLYKLVEKYVYANSQWYVYSLASNAKYTNVSVPFKPETYKDDNGNYIKYETPNYVQYDDTYYVHGKFSNGVYSYDIDSPYPGNLSNGTPTCNSVSLRYQKLTSAPSKGVLGYDYFNTVYYHPTQYITTGAYQYVKYRPLAGGETPTGVSGFDYITRKYYTGDIVYEENSLGKWWVDGHGDYQEFSTEDWEENKAKVNDGDEDTVPTLAFDKIRVTAEQYYVIENIADPFTSDSDLFDASISNRIVGSNKPEGIDCKDDCIAVKFYVNFIKPNSGNFIKVNENWGYNGGGTGILFAPTYYKYDGGYIVKELDNSGNVTRTISASDVALGTAYIVYIQIDKSLYANANGETSVFISGETNPITYTQLYNNWASYKDRKVVTGGVEVPVQYMFFVENNTLYKADNKYMIHGGELCVSTISNGDKDELNKGLYLSYEEYQIFTRYKYKFGIVNEWDNTNESWSIPQWGSYNTIPATGETEVNKGKVTMFTESCRVFLTNKISIN